jgi:hypothetical protein
VGATVTRLVVFFNHLIEEHQNALSKTPEKTHFQIADFQGVFGTPKGYGRRAAVLRVNSPQALVVPQFEIF